MQNTPLFPVCQTMDELGKVLRWMTMEPDGEEGKHIWLSTRKLSANDLSDQANLRRLVAQREVLRKKDWSLLAANHEKSVSYQLDLSDAAESFAKDKIVLPKALPEDNPLMKRIYSRMFRS